MSTLGIVFLCLALVIITLFATLAICENPPYIAFSFIGVVLLIVPFLDHETTPTNKDVKSGKAYYAETKCQEIIGNDTIQYSTYEIKWKE